MERSGWPEADDNVVCSVKRVTDFGAFVELDEYGNKEGLIHISDVASGWVKYIRDHVREGQKIVCKVMYVDTAKHHIDLSLKDVNEHQRREKIQQWKNEQKKPEVDISGYIDLTSYLPDGIEYIRKALAAANEVEGDDIKVDISYVGAPRYRIHVIAPDYKKAEGVLKKAAQSAIKIIEKADGSGEFHRHSEQKAGS